ncbi:MAG: hypothetical protein ABFD29_00900 [Anaerolineaceae bacterium]
MFELPSAVEKTLYYHFFGHIFTGATPLVFSAQYTWFLACLSNIDFLLPHLHYRYGASAHFKSICACWNCIIAADGNIYA